MTKTNKKNENTMETIQRNIDYYDNLKKECFDFYNKNFKIEHNKDENKATLTHVSSGKSYSWTYNGRLTRIVEAQLTRMANYLTYKLKINHNALHSNFFLRKWVDEKI